MRNCSILFGLIWWLIAWRSGVLDKLPPPGSTIQVGLGMVQVLASVVILFVLLQSLRGSAHAADIMTLALNAALQTDGSV